MLAENQLKYFLLNEVSVYITKIALKNEIIYLRELDLFSFHFNGYVHKEKYTYYDLIEMVKNEGYKIDTDFKKVNIDLMDLAHISRDFLRYEEVNYESILDLAIFVMKKNDLDSVNNEVIEKLKRKTLNFIHYHEMNIDTMKLNDFLLSNIEVLVGNKTLIEKTISIFR